MVIYEHVDPKVAQKYANWLNCSRGNVLVCTFDSFRSVFIVPYFRNSSITSNGLLLTSGTDNSIVTEER